MVVLQPSPPPVTTADRPHLCMSVFYSRYKCCDGGWVQLITLVVVGYSIVVETLSRERWSGQAGHSGYNWLPATSLQTAAPSHRSAELGHVTGHESVGLACVGSA